MISRSFIISYSVDYGLTAVCTVVAFLVERLPPFQRVVFLNDPSIQFPFSPVETIPSVWLPVRCHAFIKRFFAI
jgi:hypothetical protein